MTAVETPPEVDVPPVEAAVAVPAQRRPLEFAISTPRTVVRRSRLPEISLLALVCLVGYAVAAWWLKYTYHFNIGDALARTGDAKFMTFSRDAHLAAIGVYWMPLPTAVQVPLMWILEPLGRPEYAGPLSTAFWGAATVLVMGRIARDLGVPRTTGFLLTLGYALNPIVVYYAANGMAEGAEFFWLAVCFWGLLRFLRDDSASSGIIAGIGLAGLCLSKYEAIPAVAAVAAVLVLRHLNTLRKRNWHLPALNLVLLVLPAVFGIVVWLCYLKVITHSFTSFATVGAATQSGQTTPTQGVIRSVGHVGHTFDFVGHYVAAFGPAFLVLGVLLVLPSRRLPRRLLSALAVVLVTASVIAATTRLVYKGGTFGNPRYFVPVFVGATAAVMLVAGELSHRYRRLLVDPLLLAALVLCGVTGVVAENGHTESVEHEERVFGLFQGHYNSKVSQGDYAYDYQQVAKQIDSRLQPGDRVLLDSRFSGTTELYSRKPRQFILNADRDYEAIVAPTGANYRINWAVTTPEAGSRGLSVQNDDAYQLVHSPEQRGWTQVWANGVAAIWHHDPKIADSYPYPPRG